MHKQFIAWFMYVVKEKYKAFDGRASRAEFWYFAITYFVLSIIVGVVVSILVSITTLTFLNLLSTIFSLVLLLPSLSVGIRRMHDIGKSGWWVLVPLYNLYLWYQLGDTNANQYGEVPSSEIPTNTEANTTQNA